jgi:uncharacterized protein YcnI
MRAFLPRIAFVGAFLTLAVSAPAWAHVVVSPEEVTAGEYATLTVSVPTEKEVPTTRIRVEVPDGCTERTDNTPKARFFGEGGA